MEAREFSHRTRDWINAVAPHKGVKIDVLTDYGEWEPAVVDTVVRNADCGTVTIRWILEDGQLSRMSLMKWYHLMDKEEMMLRHNSYVCEL